MLGKVPGVGCDGITGLQVDEDDEDLGFDSWIGGSEAAYRFNHILVHFLAWDAQHLMNENPSVLPNGALVVPGHWPDSN